MKHLNKIFAGAAVLVLLTGCDLFKHSISAEKYQEKVDKLEQHQYSEATVTVKEEIVEEQKANEVMHTTNTGFGAELIPTNVKLDPALDMLPKYSSLINLLP